MMINLAGPILKVRPAFRIVEVIRKYYNLENLMLTGGVDTKDGMSTASDSELGTGTGAGTGAIRLHYCQSYFIKNKLFSKLTVGNFFLMSRF